MNFSSVPLDISFDNIIENDNKKNSDFHIDGIVIRDNNYHPINYGQKGKNPKYSFAFKMIHSVL